MTDFRHALEQTDGAARVGRLHTAREALDAVAIARSAFDRYSFDLIYARPGQSVADWRRELGEALSFGTEHLSVYQLTIEEGTRFHDRARDGAALVGEDEAATTLTSLLKTRRIQSHLQPVSGGKTITKLRIVSRQQQLIRLDFEDAFTDDQAHALLNAFNARLNDADAVILSDYAKGALRQVSDMIQLARQAGKPVIVDTKGHDFQRYRGATVITPNMGEFEAVVGRCHDEDDIETKGQALRRSLELEAVLVTRSEKGMSLLMANQPAMHISTRAQEVFDVTGAGDTVIATLGASLASGLTLRCSASCRRGIRRFSSPR